MLLSHGAVLTRLEPADGRSHATASIQVALAGAGTVTVELDTSSTIDVAAEIARADKDLAVAEKEVADTAKQAGQRRSSWRRRPEAVVDKIRERAAKAAADVDRLTERLRRCAGIRRRDRRRPATRAIPTACDDDRPRLTIAGRDAGNLGLPGERSPGSDEPRPPTRRDRRGDR